MEFSAGGCRWIIAEDFTFDDVEYSGVYGTSGKPSKIE
jgi:hypothetical protein